MSIIKNGSQPSVKGPEEWFTGSVRLDPLFDAPGPEGHVHGALVTFEPGARTAWHVHPMGQTLIVVSGCGWTRIEGEEKQEMRPGDVVSCPPDVRHWHGASSMTAMAHIAIQEDRDGKVVEWMEKVADEEYMR